MLHDLNECPLYGWCGLFIGLFWSSTADNWQQRVVSSSSGLVQSMSKLVHVLSPLNYFHFAICQFAYSAPPSSTQSCTASSDDHADRLVPYVSLYVTFNKLHVFTVNFLQGHIPRSRLWKNNMTTRAVCSYCHHTEPTVEKLFDS